MPPRAMQQSRMLQTRKSVLGQIALTTHTERMPTIDHCPYKRPPPARKPGGT